MPCRPLVGRAAVVQDVFGHLLRVAVGRGGGFAGRLLRDGQCVGLAVDRCRRREEDVRPAELLHQRADVHERREVVAVIFERFGDRLADSLVGGEMDDGAEIVFSKTRRSAASSQVSTCSKGTSTPVMRRTPSTAAASELERLSMMTASYPAAISSTAVCEPMYPAPPEISTVSLP